MIDRFRNFFEVSKMDDRVVSELTYRFPDSASCYKKASRNPIEAYFNLVGTYSVHT